MRPEAKALVKVRTIASWPIRSGKTRGRYLRARTRYPEAFEPLVTSLMAGQGADVRGGRLDGQPVPVSLGLLPSGPDPVGERHVRRQPPAGLYRRLGFKRQGRDLLFAGTLQPREVSRLTLRRPLLK